MFKRLCSVLLCALLMVQTMGIALAAEPVTIQEKLEVIERTAYGSEQTGALLDRVSHLEADFAGSSKSAAIMDRVDDLYGTIFLNDNGPSLLTKMNAIEWGIRHQVSMKSIQARVTDMEMELSGKPSEGSYNERVAALANYAYGSRPLPLTQYTVPANTLLLCELVTPINAKNLKEGDVIEYRAAEDIIVNGLLVLAKGAPGRGYVTKVSQAKNFGRDAKVVIDFKSMRAMDGSDVAVCLGDEAKEQMKSMGMAAGASLAGIAVLGPLGVVGGAFVKGKNIDLPEGTEIYIQTQDAVNLYGIEVNSK